MDTDDLNFFVGTNGYKECFSHSRWDNLKDQSLFPSFFTPFVSFAMHTNALLGLLALATAVVAAPSPKNAGSPASIQHMKSKIKNVVLIVMENRSLDNLLGGQTIRGLDNPINNGPFCNPVNLTDPSAGVACSEAKDYDSITQDPDHSIPGNNIEFYGTFTPDNELIANGQLEPSMNGFVHEQIRRNPTKDHMVLANQVMNYYTEEQVPVLTALTQNFVVFNRWFSSVPGVS
jgi:phospholipase C